MSDHGTHHHHEAAHPAEIKSKTSFQASFWFVVILVGLFLAALNFISAMSHDESHGSAATEQHGGGHGEHAVPGHEAAGHQSTPDHGGANEALGTGAAQVHSIGSSDNREADHGTDSAAHHE